MAEKEKEVLVKGKVPEGKDLGSVTYLDPDKSGQGVTMQGITFMPGESVDVDKMLNEDAANRLKQKLAGNQYFRVEGGPDHSKVTEARMKHEEEAQKKQAEAAEKAQREAQRRQQEQPQPPGDWKGPDHPTLESDSRSSKAQRDRR